MPRFVPAISKDWISGNEVARRLDVNAMLVPRIADEAKIRRRAIPGTRVKYWAADVARIAAEVDANGPGVAPKAVSQ